MKPLNILISNDDGVFAAGIRALAKSAHKRGRGSGAGGERPLREAEK